MSKAKNILSQVFSGIVFCLIIFIAIAVGGIVLDKGADKYAREAENESGVTSNAYSDKGKQQAWIERSKNCVLDRLKDPKSAEFKNVRFITGNANGQPIPLVFGEVNSRNALGGYVGFQRFISGGKTEVTFLEDEVLDFDATLQMLGADQIAE